MKTLQARSKLPKKRRRVLPVEQPRRKKKEEGPINRRMNAIKHHPTAFKDAFGNAKLGNKPHRDTCEEVAESLRPLPRSLLGHFRNHEPEIDQYPCVPNDSFPCHLFTRSLESIAGANFSTSCGSISPGMGRPLHKSFCLSNKAEHYGCHVGVNRGERFRTMRKANEKHRVEWR